MAFLNADGSELIGGELPSGVGQALQLDASGNLKMTGAAGVNLNQVNGGPLAASNPVLVESNIQTWIRLGQGFNATSGAQSTAGAVNSAAFSLFNPAASGKNVYVFSLKLLANLASIFALVNLVTSDPGFTAAQANNLSIGGAAPVAHATYSNTAQTPTGTTIDRMIVPPTSCRWSSLPMGPGCSYQQGLPTDSWCIPI